LSLGRIDYQVLWLFYPADKTFSDLTQFRGKRIALGPLGSGTRIVAEKILNISGVTSENTTLLKFAPQEAVGALNAGAIDALFLSFSPDSPILHSLLGNPLTSRAQGSERRSLPPPPFFARALTSSIRLSIRKTPPYGPDPTGNKFRSPSTGCVPTVSTIGWGKDCWISLRSVCSCPTWYPFC